MALAVWELRFLLAGALHGGAGAAARAAAGRPRPRLAHAFTLVEVMISIALVMILIIGVAQVFNMTSQTVSSGQALQTLTRDARAVEATLAQDVAGMLTGSNQPAIAIWSQRDWRFLDANAEAADLDKNPQTVDANENGLEGDAWNEVLSPAIYSSRNHRVDMLVFFSTGNFQRQTSPDDTRLAGADGGGTSSEAMISYGHLMVRSQSAPATPGANYQPLPTGFARDWRLGRTAILLQPDPSNGYVGGNHPLDPLRADSPTTDNAFRLFNSRFDVAATSASQYGSKLVSSGSGWWSQAVVFRFEADPDPNPTGGYDAAEVARMVPVFLNNCTSIIVEYAGDFLYQYDHAEKPNEPHLWGAPGSTYTAPRGTDGQTDFYYDPYIPAGSTVDPTTSRRKVRWYGLPRDVNGDGGINVVDVIPLRDIWKFTRDGLIANGEPDVGERAPFEKDPHNVMPGAPRLVAQRTMTGSDTGMGYADMTPDPGNPTRVRGMNNDEGYYCAWEPQERKPSMIRVTLRMDDPNGRLPEGLTFQYVLKVPGG